MTQNALCRYNALITNDSLTRSLGILLVTVSTVLLMVHTFPFNAYAQQGGSATSGPAIGGSASGPGSKGGEAKSGEAIGGAANGSGSMGANATSGAARGANSTNISPVPQNGPH
ncbi:MAG: hypothetical protein ACTHKP_05915 [Nitrososphaeraceae archaeon]